MKIRFLYHKTQGERGVGKAIVIWTGFLALFYAKGKALKYNFSHEEIWLPDENGDFWEHCSCWDKPANCTECYIEGKIFVGQCFSSTTRGKWKGVRFASGAEILSKHPERWEYIECEVDAERLEVAVEEARRLVGKKYDYLGIFGFLNPFPIQDDKRWYCSEICHRFKVLCCPHIKPDKRISPRRSAYKLAKAWGEPKPLV